MRRGSPVGPTEAGVYAYTEVWTLRSIYVVKMLKLLANCFYPYLITSCNFCQIRFTYYWGFEINQKTYLVE